GGRSHGSSRLVVEPGPSSKRARALEVIGPRQRARGIDDAHRPPSSLRLPKQRSSESSSGGLLVPRIEPKPLNKVRRSIRLVVEGIHVPRKRLPSQETPQLARNLPL